MRILGSTEMSIVTEMSVVELNGLKKGKDFIVIIGCNESMKHGMQCVCMVMP